jgi:hypothetical protein
MPFARKKDPVTSHLAAESVQHLSATQKTILDILKKPHTDEQLIDRYRELARKGKAQPASESGIRSRRSELHNLELIKPVGESLTQFNRRCLVWSTK